MTEHDGPTLSDDERFFAEHSIQYAASADQLPDDVNWEPVADWLTTGRFLNIDERTGKTPLQLFTESYGEAFYTVPSTNQPEAEDSPVKLYAVFGDKDAREDIYAKTMRESGETTSRNIVLLASISSIFLRLPNGEIVAPNAPVLNKMVCIEASAGYSQAVELIMHVLEKGQKWYVVPIFGSDGKITYNRVSLWAMDTSTQVIQPKEIGRRTTSGSWLKVINGGENRTTD